MSHAIVGRLERRVIHRLDDNSKNSKSGRCYKLIALFTSLLAKPSRPNC